jgi:hypothetical protein
MVLELLVLEVQAVVVQAAKHQFQRQHQALTVAVVAALLRMFQFPQVHQVLEHQGKEMQAEFQQVQTVNLMPPEEVAEQELLGYRVLVQTDQLEMAVPVLHH